MALVLHLSPCSRLCNNAHAVQSPRRSSSALKHEACVSATFLRQAPRGMQRPQPGHICAAANAQASPTAAPSGTEWFQKTVTLSGMKRGCHVMTREVASQVPEIAEFEVGMANFFLLHTSASLTINENASSDVPLDLNDALDKLAPEGGHYRHLDEGYDDMPAHVKSSLMGASLDVPISRGRLALGTWQGIYLNEHRNYGGARSMVVTIQGQKRADGQRYSQYK